jgi:uncharacterized protein YoxC
MASWIGPTAAISLLIIALCFLAIVSTLLVTLKGLMEQSISLGKEFQQLRQEMAPTLKYLGELGREGASVAEMAKDEIKELVKTSRGIREEVERGVKRAKRRLEDLEAVVEVVQEEVEETALDVGAALRSARQGAGMIGKLRRLLVPPRTRRS